MKLTKRGEIVLALGTVLALAISTYVGWLFLRSVLMFWQLRGYDVQ